MPIDRRSDATSLQYLVLCCGVVFAYLPAVTGEFIWDDNVHVSENMMLRSLRGLQWIWTRLGATPQYYPLTHTTFWAQYQLFGPSPAAYHVVNILLHVVSAITLWRLLRRLSVPGAYLAALLFAWHPVHVESVAWISERKNTLSAMFYLLAMACAVRAFGLDRDDVPEPSQKRWPDRRWYGAMVILSIAGMLSKTITGTLPAAIMLLAWWKRGRIDWRLATWLSPLWIAAVVFGQITAYMERVVVGASGPDWQFTFVERFLIATRAIVFYLGKLLWPTDLSFIYPRWTIDPTVAWQWLFPGALLVTLLVIALLRKRTGRGPIAALLYFMITVFPALGFVNIYPMRYSFVADHFQYLASIGPFILTATIAVRVFKLHGHKITAGTILCGTAVACLLPLTFFRSMAFASSEVLWADVLSKDPTSVIARTQLAAIATEEERFDDAWRLYQETLAVDPKQVEALVGLSNLALRQADLAAAEAFARQAVSARPRRILPLLQLAKVLAVARPTEAIGTYRSILDLDDRYEPARLALAKLLALSGRLDDAIDQCQRAIAIYPEGLQARTLLGDLYLNRGDDVRAAEAYRSALALDPENAALKKRLALLGGK